MLVYEDVLECRHQHFSQTGCEICILPHDPASDALYYFYHMDNKDKNEVIIFVFVNCRTHLVHLGEGGLGDHLLAGLLGVVRLDKAVHVLSQYRYIKSAFVDTVQRL